MPSPLGGHTTQWPPPRDEFPVELVPAPRLLAPRPAEPVADAPDAEPPPAPTSPKAAPPAPFEPVIAAIAGVPEKAVPVLPEFARPGKATAPPPLG